MCAKYLHVTYLRINGQQKLGEKVIIKNYKSVIFKCFKFKNKRDKVMKIMK